MARSIRIAVASLFVVCLSFAPAQGDDKRHAELALQLIQVSGETDPGPLAAAGLLPQLKPAFPTVPDELWAEIAATFSSEELTQLSVSVYTKYFSERELSEIVAFYRSSLGRKLLEVTPVVMQEIVVAGGQWADRKVQEITETLQAAGHQPQGM